MIRLVVAGIERFPKYVSLITHGMCESILIMCIRLGLHLVREVCRGFSASGNDFGTYYISHSCCRILIHFSRIWDPFFQSGLLLGQVSKCCTYISADKQFPKLTKE